MVAERRLPARTHARHHMNKCIHPSDHAGGGGACPGPWVDCLHEAHLAVSPAACPPDVAVELARHIYFHALEMNSILVPY